MYRNLLLTGVWISKAVFLSFCLSALFFACDRSDQVLATYQKDKQNEKITRKELRWLVKLQNRGNNKTLPSTEFQHNLLKSYALAKIISYEAKQANVEQSDAYKKHAVLLEETVRLLAYELYLREQGIELNYEFVELQLILLSNKKEEKNKENEKEKEDSEADEPTAAPREKEADALIADLNSSKTGDEKAIEEKVYQNSEHPRYRLQGGYLDPACVSCVSNPFADVSEQIKKAKPGKFFKIKRPNAIWILRIVRRYTIEEDDIQDKIESLHRKTSRVARRYFTKLSSSGQGGSAAKNTFKQLLMKQSEIEKSAKQKSEWLIQKERQNLVLSKMNQVKKQKKYVLHEAGKLAGDLKERTYKDDTVLYSIAGQDYTYKLLQKELSQWEDLKEPPEQIRAMHNILLPLALVEKEKTFQKSQKHEIFSFIHNYLKNRALMFAYYKQKEEAMEIEENEVLKLYEQGKQGRYRNVPLKQALEAIRKRLKQGKSGETIRKMQEDLIAKYKLTIKNELLEAEAI